MVVAAVAAMAAARQHTGLASVCSAVDVCLMAACVLDRGSTVAVRVGLAYWGCSSLSI